MSEPAPDIIGNSGAVASNVSVGRDFNQDVKIVYQYLGDFIRKYRLDPAHITKLLRTYEPPPGRDRAAELLARHHAVALVGSENTGRRTTAVQLLHERNVRPHALAFERKDDLVELPCDLRSGYLFSADGWDAAAIENYAARLRTNDSYLVLWATQDVTRPAGTFMADIAVPLGTPLPEGVFRRSLDARLSPADAGWWRTCQELEPLVKSARPADVVWLVELIRRTTAVRGCTKDAVADVLDAYRNWEEHLQGMFARSGIDLRKRVRLIAVAVLEKGPESAAYEAATALGERLGVPAEEGHGLAGAGTRCLRGEGEISCDDGVVRFVRPAFAESLLNYVARTYPFVWEEVRTWLTELPGRVRYLPDAAPALARLVHTLVDLAARRNDSDLLRLAVDAWSEAPGTRPFAVELLSIAALKPALGRWTRQWIYDSAYNRGGTEGRQTAIAEACAHYGIVYPDNAITRLRHLAAAEHETVRSAVRHSVTELAGDDKIRTRVLTKLGAWVQGTKGRAIGCEAFLDIVEIHDDQGHPAVIAEAAQRRTHHLSDALSRGWQGALIEPATAERARILIAAWFDDALISSQTDGAERTGVVVRILGQAAQEDARYLPRFIRAVDAWYAQEETVPDRIALRRMLIDTASSEDPLLSVQKGEGAA